MTSRPWSHVLYLAIVLLLAANLVVMAMGKPKPAYAAAAPRQYRYKVISPTSPPDALEKAMNEAGAQGWKYEGAMAGSQVTDPLLIFSK